MPFLGEKNGIDSVLELRGSVVDKLVSCLPDQNGSQFYTIKDNFFTSVWLLKHLKAKNIVAASTKRENQT